ncbi:hypothetical protein MMC10_008704 [Thelotrema lepadinum]|nr:hypothetical protein [Thelotrema lepadinum]
MQLQYLCSFELDADIERSLGRLPPDLFTLYAEIYEAMSKRPGVYRGQVLRNVLSWLLCAQKPMTGEELLAAVSIKLQASNVSISISKDLVLGLCHNFVIFDDQLDTYRFAHLSVREFLETRPEYSGSAINALAAEVCLLNWVQLNPEPKTKTFLTKAGYALSADLTVLYQLKSYSGLCWPLYCQLAADERSSGTLGRILDFFMSERDGPDSILHWVAWLGPYIEHDRIPNWLAFYSRLSFAIVAEPSVPAVACFVACAFDLCEIVGKMKNVICLKDLGNTLNQSLLQVAVWSGSLNSLRTLIDSERLHPEIIQDLLELAALPKRNGIPVDIFVSIIDILLDLLQAFELSEKILIAAARNENSEILALILDRRGHDIVITEKIAMETAKSGFSNTMVLLLDRRSSEIDITQGLLQRAARNFWDGKAMLTVLLEQSENQVMITEDFLETVAGNEGHGSAIMELLLDLRQNKIDITEKVLRAAATNFRNGKNILKLVSERVDNVKLTDSVMMAAASNGFEDILELLSNMSDSSNDKDKWFGISQLRHVAEVGEVNVVRQLVKNRVPLDNPDRYGNTPLWWASRSGRTEVVQILLATKAVNVNAQGRLDRTPLFVAALHGFAEIVQLLLDHGARQDAKPNLYGETPLSIARERRHDRIVDILTKHQERARPID